MSWASFLASIFKLFNAIATYLNNKQLLDAGGDKARGETAEKNSEFLATKVKIQEDVSGLSDEQLDARLSEWDKPSDDTTKS